MILYQFMLLAEVAPEPADTDMETAALEAAGMVLARTVIPAAVEEDRLQ
jgi:hypothetical protein